MKPRTTFLQAVIVLIGIATLAIMIRMPLTEGRAVHLDLWSIYLDPFIIYVYVASIAFLVALFQAFTFLGYIKQGNAFSLNAVHAIRRIKHCAIILSILIVMAGIYIRIFHAQDDDPAGFLALCGIATFGAVVVATAVSVLEKILQDALDMKAGHDTTL